MICLACGKDQNRNICWSCWGSYIKFSKQKVSIDLDGISKEE